MITNNLNDWSLIMRTHTQYIQDVLNNPDNYPLVERLIKIESALRQCTKDDLVDMDSIQNNIDIRSHFARNIREDITLRMRTLER